MLSRSSGVALGLGSQPSCSSSLVAQRNSVPALNVRASRSRSLALLSRERFGKGFSGSFCHVSDALGADLLDRSYSIPDPQLVRRIVSQVQFYLSDENLAKDALSFCNMSDALGADLLDRSYSIPDPQLVRRIVSQVQFYLSDENLAKDAL